MRRPMSTEHESTSVFRKTLGLAACLFISACGFQVTEQLSTHCYLKAALELIYGPGPEADQLFESEKDSWEPVGHVEQAFHYYNNDESLELYVTSEFSEADIANWLAQGYRVVILYELPPNNHAIYIEDASIVKGKNVLWTFVAGCFACEGESL